MPCRQNLLNTWETAQAWIVQISSPVLVSIMVTLGRLECLPLFTFFPERQLLQPANSFIDIFRTLNAFRLL
jgi:hypothetical protein